jgi:23S rRNA pseudouridine1911/1915/1917 synthase
VEKHYKARIKDAGRRLDVVVTERAGGSRSAWQARIKAGKVLVGGRALPANHLLSIGEKITIELDTPIAAAKPAAPDVPVIYEDADVVVINKPAGILVHDTPTKKGEPTIVGFASTKSNDPDPDRPGIVHRLDRDTSGVMIIAKTEAAKEFLQKQFHDRLTSKEYLALVEGHLRQAEATISLPIGRKSGSARYVIGLTGKPAETTYKVEAEFAHHSYIHAFPKTGRTHQIRVHLAHLGHPIAGDRLYGGHRTLGLIRQFLHAHRLSLQLPSGQQRSFEAPLPPDLQTILDKLYKQVY